MTTAESIQLALTHHQAGRFPQAETIYRQILAQQPNEPDALHLLGMVAHQSGRNGEAVALINRAIAANPSAAHFHANLGAVLATSGDLSQAIPHFQHAVELQPHDAGARENLLRAYLNFGNELYARGDMDQAAHYYQIVATQNPGDPNAHYNLGLALTALGEAAGAIACFQQAIDLRPDYPEALAELGDALRMANRHEEAGQALRRSVDLLPTNVKALNSLGNYCKDMADLPHALRYYQRAVELDPTTAIADSNFIYTLVFDPDQDTASMLHHARQWNQRHAEPLARHIQPHANDRSPNRRLKIGYVSPNLREHSQAPFILPLLRHHDHQVVEVFCYCDSPRPDAITEKFQACADVWRTTAQLSDEDLADLIRRDGIDILIDLTMHMAKSRLLAFARKPAPIQVAWLAYPGTTGVTAIDYRFTDPHLDPPGSDAFYTEKSIRLPRTFACFDPQALDAPWPDPGRLPLERNGHVTFGCLNNFCKINEPLLNLWSGVLRSVPRGRLRLLAPTGEARPRVLNVFSKSGVSSDRIDFVPSQARRHYLEELNGIDICLDTLPYHGHTTSLDALFSSVPVVSRLGHTSAGRAAWSLASNLGLTELVADTDEMFVKIAVELAGDAPRLSDLRRTLRDRLRNSPITDGPAFARDVESAYREMWDRLIHS